MNRDFRELVISGDGDLSKLERFVEEICDYYNINNEYFGNILLATTEAAGILLSSRSRRIKQTLLSVSAGRPGGLFSRSGWETGMMLRRRVKISWIVKSANINWPAIFTL